MYCITKKVCFNCNKKLLLINKWYMFNDNFFCSNKCREIAILGTKDKYFDINELFKKIDY